MKIGKIEISQQLIRDYLYSKDFNGIKEIFEKIIPLRIEENFLNRINTYTCVCDDFEELEEGTTILYYDLEINKKMIGCEVVEINININKR